MLVTRLCGVLAPDGPRSDSGSRLFSGENQWFNISSALENVYDAVTTNGLVRCAPENRMPWYHERPSLVSTSICRKPFGPGTLGRVRSACACVRTIALGLVLSAALSTSLGTGVGAFISRNPCLTPRLMLKSTATLARAPIWCWTPRLPFHECSFSRSGEIS